MAANALDLENARESNLAGPLLKRLALSEAKLRTLADGIVALAQVRVCVPACVHAHPNSPPSS